MEYRDVEPPHDPTTEHGIISCLFQCNELLASCSLTTEHFYLAGTRALFEAILALDNESAAFDFMTVTAELRKRGKLDDIGGDPRGTGFPCNGAAYVTEIFTACVAPIGTFSYLCGTLERMRKYRALQAALIKGLQGVNSRVEPDAIASTLDNEISKPTTEAVGSVTKQAIADVREQILARQIGGKIGTPTDVMPWDNTLGGLMDGGMYLVGARPKVGKTALMEVVMRNIARRGERVLCFQRDMNVTLMIARMACREAGVVFEDYHLGRASNGELIRVENALKLINPDLVHIYPNELTIQEMRAVQRNLMKKGPLSAVFVDVFGKIKITDENEVKGFTFASNGIRACANDFGVPWVVNAHVNKEAEKTGRPLPSQFRYCDQLFMDCDIAAMMWSPEDPKEMTDAKGNHYRQKVLLSIEGNRGGGVGDIILYFDRPLMKFFATENKPY